MLWSLQSTYTVGFSSHPPILPTHHRRMRRFIALFSWMSILIIPRRSSDLPKASWLVKGRARTHSEAPWPQILSRHYNCSTRCLNVPMTQRGEGLWPHFGDVGNHISERMMTLGAGGFSGLGLGPPDLLFSGRASQKGSETQTLYGLRVPPSHDRRGSDRSCLI